MSSSNNKNHVPSGKSLDHQGEKNLLKATLLNVFITIVEIVGGILSNSLALLSDAIHNLSDALAIFIAWIANQLSKRESTPTRTFGWKRMEILVAMLNATILMVICVFLVREAWVRWQDPRPIKGLIMFTVATLGLLANLYAVILLHRDSKHNLNIKAAYLHLLGDTFSSVAVIAGGLLIYFYHLYWIDPLITAGISLYIIYESWKILKETVDILMHHTPRGLDIHEISTRLEQVDKVENIHHLHIWSLTDNRVHFECHACLNQDISLSESEQVREEILGILREDFGIDHAIIQLEYDPKCNKNLLYNSR